MRVIDKKISLTSQVNPIIIKKNNRMKDLKENAVCIAEGELRKLSGKRIKSGRNSGEQRCTEEVNRKGKSFR